jgi:hypothetical protein
MSGLVRALRITAALAAGVALASPLAAATYLPISDGELARRSPVIVQARVHSQAITLETIDRRQMAMTIVTFERLETIKGRLSADAFNVRLAGGRAENIVTWIPGTPSFEAGQELLLFLRPAPGHAGDFAMSEFALGHFEIRADSSGRRFAVRPEFPPEEDDYLSRRAAAIAPVAIGESPKLRVADSFIRTLRAMRREGASWSVEYAKPQGALSDSRGRIRSLWVNLGGPEPGNCGGTPPQPCLFRWFTDTGASPSGVVTVVGTQSNLSDGSNGTPGVQNAVTQWTAVPSSTVPYSGPSGSGNVSIQLDAPQSFDGGAAFNGSLPCGAGGVLGLGGTQNASGPMGGYTFKGDANYFAMQTAIITMRKLTGAPGCYPAQEYECAVLHEMGHTLGLGHPDQGTSKHSTTSPSDWANAVMHSVLPPSNPTKPQTDDIQAIQFYYGTGVGPTATPTPTSPAGPTPTPTGGAPGPSRAHVTPLKFVTPKSNVNGRQ